MIGMKTLIFLGMVSASHASDDLRISDPPSLEEMLNSREEMWKTIESDIVLMNLWGNFESRLGGAFNSSGTLVGCYGLEVEDGVFIGESVDGVFADSHIFFKNGDTDFVGSPDGGAVLIKSLDGVYVGAIHWGPGEMGDQTECSSFVNARSRRFWRIHQAAIDALPLIPVASPSEEEEFRVFVEMVAESRANDDFIERSLRENPGFNEEVVYMWNVMDIDSKLGIARVSRAVLVGCSDIKIEDGVYNVESMAKKDDSFIRFSGVSSFVIVKDGSAVFVGAPHGGMLQIKGSDGSSHSSIHWDAAEIGSRVECSGVVE